MSNKAFDPARWVFYFVLLVGVVGLSFGIGLYSGVRRNVLFRGVQSVVSSVRTSVETVVGEASTLTGTHPTHFLQPSRYSGAGVTVKAGADDGLVLLSGFFDDSNELRLVRRDGTIVARWPVRFSSIFPDTSYLPEGSIPATDWNIDTHGALALPDGSVIFNFEFGGLVKLDRCGKTVWSLAHRTHHSVERAEGGGYWVPGRRLIQQGPSLFPPFEPPFNEDLILKVSEEGKIVAEHSVTKLLYDNGLEAILTATGSRFRTGMPWDQEIIHLNKIEELSKELAADFPTLEPGDLLLSLRDQNLLMIADGALAKVKWWKIGPWRRQHDPEFRSGGTITLFNNNAYETIFGIDDDVSPLTAPRVSNISDINPATGDYRVLYGGNGQELLSVIRGKVDITPGGGLLITEFEGGRVLETDPHGKIIWEYVNRYSAEEVGELTEARLYPAGYFEVTDWSCRASSQQ